ncbi:MAG: alpha/beta fold hydrolase [Mogibacterium sp.]|nr:alpha/beta fold hydrolase [Mogibacterium sp.]
MITKKVIVGGGTEFPLNGQLVLPDDLTERVPAVVFVHGSGPSNMDEQIYSLTPFKDLAEGLAERGIASIRYDKRTYAYARKVAKLAGVVTVKEETIEDAIRAADLARTIPEIDPERIFIVGHSMGAMLAPRIDAEGGNFRGLVLMAGTPLRLENIVIRQLKQASGEGSGIMKMVVKLEDKIFSKKFDGLYDMPDDEARRKKFFGGTSLYYFKEMGRKTAAEYLIESDKPVLIMQGGMDFQVLKDVDFAAFQKLLADRPNVEYRLYDDLNHLFVKGVFNSIMLAAREYKKKQHIGPEVIDDIAAFVKSN